MSISGKEAVFIQKEWARIDRLSQKSIASVAMPSADDLRRAHKTYFEKAKRDVFYRAAVMLIPKALNGQSEFPLADVLELFLQTWNRQYYRFHPWSAEHHRQIELLLNECLSQISTLRQRVFSSYIEGFSEEGMMWFIFNRFKQTLGPVGAAKALHVLAPAFCPLWEGEIAKQAYRVPLDGAGYVAMMRAVQVQLANLGNTTTLGGNPLKLIDEYNYCHYAKGWI